MTSPGDLANPAGIPPTYDAAHGHARAIYRVDRTLARNRYSAARSTLLAHYRAQIHTAIAQITTTREQIDAAREQLAAARAVYHAGLDAAFAQYVIDSNTALARYRAARAAATTPQTNRT